ncbi:hypothetical protein OAI33_15110 [Pirellulaceae bacterium]|nr:hypothetical protein [Pirellulaceae bacterium]
MLFVALRILVRSASKLPGSGGLAKHRRGDLARLSLRAMLGGTLAAFMTACFAGMLYGDPVSLLGF